MSVVNLHLTHKNCTEFEPFKFCVEASSLGLRPGEIPAIIHTDLGNGQPFMLRYADNEVFEYQQQFGCIMLRVFND